MTLKKELKELNKQMDELNKEIWSDSYHQRDSTIIEQKRQSLYQMQDRYEELYNQWVESQDYKD